MVQHRCAGTDGATRGGRVAFARLPSLRAISLWIAALPLRDLRAPGLQRPDPDDRSAGPLPGSCLFAATQPPCSPDRGLPQTRRPDPARCSVPGSPIGRHSTTTSLAARHVTYRQGRSDAPDRGEVMGPAWKRSAPGVRAIAGWNPKRATVSWRRVQDHRTGPGGTGSRSGPVTGPTAPVRPATSRCWCAPPRSPRGVS